MILTLSMTSSQALMAIFDEAATSPLASREWNNVGGIELGDHLEEKYSELKKEIGSAFLLTKIFGVEGPGSFTGLRVSSAFLKGLATALNIPLVGISSYDLFGEAFAFSLRPAKAANLTLEECVEKEYKFLQVNSHGVEVLAQPTCKKIVGLKDSPFWPNLEQLQLGLQHSLSKKTFVLDYGYTPEFVKAGQHAN